jgi:hypothetical protein
MPDPRSRDRGVEPDEIGAADELVQLAIVDQRARIEIGNFRRDAAGQPVVSHCAIGRIAERPAVIASTIASGPFRPRTRRRCRSRPRSTHSSSATLRALVAGAVDFRGMAHDDTAVRATEAERVRHGNAHALPSRRTGDEVEIAVDVALHEIRVDRHFAAMDGERAYRDFDGAGGSDEVPIVLLVELTLTRMTSSPKTACVAAVSLRSFMPVDVPCAFR